MVDKAHQPIEDADVAVHTDVNVIQALRVTEILLKVFHVGDQQVFVALEVFVHLFVFIADMNYYLSCCRIAARVLVAQSW